MEKEKEKKKNKQAVALRYDRETDRAPKIIASGQGLVAENILKAAEESDVFIRQDTELVRELMTFKVGTEIPPELYEVVAQILVFVDMVDESKGRKNT
ncbi:MAG: flagellar biogenesis protein [Clostridiales bacterium]|nr:flagellar biogenesis protein [Clostridiales bacterium]